MPAVTQDERLGLSVRYYVRKRRLVPRIGINAARSNQKRTGLQKTGERTVAIYTYGDILFSI